MRSSGRPRPAVRAAVVALLCCALSCGVLSGCSKAQPGTADVGGWASTTAYDALRSIPAGFQTRYDIGLVNPSVLNRVAQIGGNGGATTAPSTGGRPPSERDWIDDSVSASGCATILDDSPSSTPRTGPPGLLLTVRYQGDATNELVAVCQGEVNPAPLADPKFRRVSSLAPLRVGDVDGTASENAWVGYRADTGTTFAVGTKVPETVRTAVVAGKPVPGSLADDPGVIAVLDAAPTAAMIEMGTVLLRDSTIGGTSAIETALAAAMKAAGVAALPVPEFAGYGWTPGARIVGTATFVTVYGSVQEAGTVADLLTAVWRQVPDSGLGGATTATAGSSVITTVPEVGAAEFTLRSMSVYDYPAFRTRD